MTPLRVLIVEDSSDDALLQVLELQRAGHTLSWKRVETRHEMRAALDSKPFDLILSDYNLPEFSAQAALKLANEIAGDLPFIVVSGTIGEDVAVEMMRSGASDYVLKHNLVRLGHAVKRELREAENRRKQKRAEQAANRLVALVQSTEDAILGRTLDGLITDWNPGAERLYGYTAEEIIGKPISVLVPPDRTDDLAEIKSRLERGERIAPYETIQLRKDGSQVHVSLTVSPVFNEEGKAIAAVIIARDISEMRRANEYLLQSQREAAEHLSLLETWLGNAPIGFAFIDRGFRYVRVNDALAVLNGVAAAEMIGRTVEQVLPQVWPQVKPICERLLGDGGPSINSEISIEIGTLRQVRHCLVSHFPVRIDGEIIGIGVIVNDITERKNAEVALARYAATVRDSRDSIIGMTLDGIVTDWNPGAKNLYGYTAEEMIGKPFSILLPPDRVKDFDEILGRIGQGRGTKDHETVRIRKDGSIVHVSLTVSPLHGKQGAIVGASSVARDISDQKRAEEALRLRDRAMQAVASGILIADPNQLDNPIIYASPGFERLTGYRHKEVLGRNCRFLQGKDTERAAVAEVRAAIQQARSCDVELLNYRKDGTTFWNRLLISPVHDETGRLTHFVGVQTDVTERRSLEDQFRQAQKMEAVGRLAGGVAHDFNNLLTIINGYGTIVMNSLSADNPARNLLQQITHAGERAAGLTRQLLAFSRKTVLEPKVLDLNTQVREMAKLVDRLIGEDIDLTTSLDPDLGRVKVDPGQLEQAVINLCVNARDAMPHGGRITIETHNVELDEIYAKEHKDVHPGSYVLLAVTDTGHGMDEATKRRIFEPFFTTKELGKGTGLGLAMVFGFVTQSGGHISVYSEPGEGATFKLYLPSVQGTASSAKSHHGLGVLPEGNETILLVEDEIGVRSLVRHLLQTCGYTVLDAGFGKDAVRIAEQNTGVIHLLITDVVMPQGMGGRQVAEAVCARHPETKVLFVSGYTDDAVVRHGILEEKTSFLQKPFTPSSLAQKVREVLDQPE